MNDEDLLSLTVGRFLVAFCNAEFQITRNLAHALGMRDFEAFDHVASGLTVDHKSKQLIKALEAGYGIAEPMKKRINLFKETVRMVRNDLSHHELSFKAGKVVCSSLGRFRDPSISEAHRNGIGSTTRYEVAYLEALTAWLRDFTADLYEAGEPTWHEREMSVPAYRSAAHLPAKPTEAQR